MTLIDLSRVIETGMPVFPGDPEVEFNMVLSHDSDGVQLTSLQMGSHSGTHLDVPRHYLPEGSSVDQLEPDRFYGPALVVSCPPDMDGLIRLEELDLTQLLPGDSLLLATGWEDQWGSPDYFLKTPQFAEGSADLLLKLGVGILGLDLPTVVERRTPEDIPAMHRELLSSGVILVENLVNLQTLVGRRVEFFALPLKLAGFDGSPVRACARLY